MKTILMSIKPEYVAKIFSGDKKYEYRKRTSKEKIDKIIVYSTTPVKKVVGELIIKNILYDKKDTVWKKTSKYGGISKEKYNEYYKNYDNAIAYEIEKVIVYDKPKTLDDYNIKKAPQSYVYLKNIDNGGNFNEYRRIK